MPSLFVLLIILVAALFFVLISQTRWAEENLRWCTHISFHVFLGILLGLSLVGIGYITVQSMLTLIENTN